MNQPLNTHGSIARKLISNDPDYFNGLETQYQNGFYKIKDSEITGFIHVIEMKRYILNKLENSGLDNYMFVNAVLNILQILLHADKNKGALHNV